MSKRTGGQAFPRPGGGSPGMTLRQWYAGQALAGPCAALSLDDIKRFNELDPDRCARIAFEFADAMLEEGET